MIWGLLDQFMVPIINFLQYQYSRRGKFLQLIKILRPPKYHFNDNVLTKTGIFLILVDWLKTHVNTAHTLN